MVEIRISMFCLFGLLSVLETARECLTSECLRGGKLCLVVVRKEIGEKLVILNV